MEVGQRQADVRTSIIAGCKCPRKLTYLGNGTFVAPRNHADSRFVAGFATLTSTCAHWVGSIGSEQQLAARYTGPRMIGLVQKWPF